MDPTTPMTMIFLVPHFLSRPTVALHVPAVWQTHRDEERGFNRPDFLPVKLELSINVATTSRLPLPRPVLRDTFTCSLESTYTWR